MSFSVKIHHECIAETEVSGLLEVKEMVGFSIHHHHPFLSVCNAKARRQKEFAAFRKEMIFFFSLNIAFPDVVNTHYLKSSVLSYSSQKCPLI